jgi:hypothetical protein
MRFVFKMCVALLLLGIVAESQEPAPPLQPAVRPRRTRPPRAERVQPHTGDAWYPDPPPEGDANSSPPPQTYAPPSPGAVSTAGPVVPAPAAQPATQPQSNDPLAPAAPAQVSFQNGQLTVRAINSTLESVLNAIRSKAGVQFEGLEGVGSERIAVSMGPLPEGEVLAAVLAGSRYDFIVMERPDSPGIVQRVILSPRKGSQPAGTQTSGMQPPRPAASEDDETPDEASAEPESPQDTPVHPPILQAQPQMQINPQPQQPQPGQTGPKTPEQLLEELKQMQQRQQQQPPPQQQAPQKPPP